MSMLGNRVVRKEDPALLRGLGRYTGDLHGIQPEGPDLEGLVELVFVRSTIAHAVLGEIDTSEALAADGVLAVFTAADLDLTPARAAMPWVPPMMVRPWLATDRVRFVGEPVAIVVAESLGQAVDAAELVIVDYEPLDAVVDPELALAGEIRLFDHDTNVAAEFRDEPGPAALFDGCEVVVEGRMINQRVAAAPLEGRASVASWSDNTGLTQWFSNQGVHGALRAFRTALSLDEDRVRLIAPDVGGGFGAKINPYPEDILTAWVARNLRRPARWVESRSENMVGLGHGRDQVHRFTIGGTRDGHVVAFRNEILANAGAYPAMAAFLPTFTRMMAAGTYDIERIETSAVAVVTNTTPIEAFRGAGRPEATAVIERAMDLFAAEIGMDPVEVRRRNLIAADRFPFTTPAGATYDVGNYRGALDAVLDAVDYEALRRQQVERRGTVNGPAGERLLGIGVSTYVEITAGGGAPKEFGSVRVEADGSATVLTGSSSHGQGHDTVWATLVSDRLGIDAERVTVIHGDSALVPRGGGTMGSRSLQLGGVAVHNASIELAERARGIAADLLEAAVEDVILDTELGRFHVQGVPARSLGWTDLAVDHLEELVVEHDFTAPGPTYPFGAHVAVVEVDRDTGKVEVIRMVCCDDAGVIVNPLLADGQRHGGIAQGIAQALTEEMRYDDEGTPLTSNFADYGIISACELPALELVSHVTPTPFNPLGAKGIGESGTIGATPAVQSAVIDAVAHLGVRHIDMPCTPERVWRAISDAST